MKRALFLDRDGVIIEDLGYMRDPDQVRLIPGAAEALRKLSNSGWLLFVVSNQSGVGRGLIAPQEMEAVQQRFIETLRAHGVEFAAAWLCPHAPDAYCDCRKPSPLRAIEAAKQFNLDLKASWMIGDRESDILFGRNAGCSTIWLRNSAHAVPETLPDFIADDWNAVLAHLSGL